MTIPVSYNFTAGTTINPDQVDQNFADIGDNAPHQSQASTISAAWNFTTNPTFAGGLGLAPCGVVLPYVGATAPTGWLLCNGAAVSRATYATLYAIVADAFGAGDGSTTFNLPDTRGRAPIGAGTGTALTARTLGGNVGAETVVLATGDIPAHTHTQDAHTHTQTAHGHAGSTVAIAAASTGITGGVEAFNATGAAGGDITASHVANGQAVQANTITLTDPTHGHAGSTVTVADATAVNQNATATNQNAGGGGAHANVQPSLVFNFIIKT